MARARWSKEDLPGFAKLGGIFVAIGVGYGILRGDGIFVGAMAGALLFGLMMGIGGLVEWIGRGKR